MRDTAATDDRRPAGRTTVPRLVVLTDRRRSEAAGRTLLDTVTAAVGAGAPAVLLREKDLGRDERRALAADLAAVTREHGAHLLVASDTGLARTVGAAGVHLAAGDPAPLPAPPATAPRPGTSAGGLLVGRSCHDAAEVAASVAASVDYVTVSPVAPSASKPGHGPALGADGVAALVADAGDVPVLALGGIGLPNAARFRAAGAHGVAVMGAVMGDPDPAAVVAGLLQLIEEDDR